MQDVMRKIQLKDAKANLSAVVDQATRGKPSVITRTASLSGSTWLCRLGAVVARTFLRPSSDVSAA